MSMSNEDSTSPGVEIAKIEAAGIVSTWRCPHCYGRAEILAVTCGPVPFVVGYNHDEGCPADGWDGPAIESVSYE